MTTAEIPFQRGRQLKFRLLPFKNVERSGHNCVATAPSPWLELAFDGAIPAGKWLFIKYRTGWFQDVVRVIVRCIDSRGRIYDAFLPGAMFGSAIGFAYIKRGTARILISPTNRAGRFHFGIEAVTTVSMVNMLGKGLRNDLGRTLNAIGASAIGANSEARQSLHWALSGTSLNDYDTYRKDRLRSFDLSDRKARPAASQDLPQIRLVYLGPDVQHPTVWDQERLSLSYMRIVKLRPSTGADDARVRTLDYQSSALALVDDLLPEALVFFIRQEDELPPWALAVIAETAAQMPDIDIFYGDEDSIAKTGLHIEPCLKPDWSPVRQQNSPYVGRAVVYRARYLKDRLATPQTVEAVLQERWRSSAPMITRDTTVWHIRRILLSTAKTDSGAVLNNSGPAVAPVEQIDAKHAVSVIIPSRDKASLLMNCIDGLFKKTDRTGIELEVIIVDNGSRMLKTQRYYESLRGISSVRIIRDSRKFNFSSMCNKGAEAALHPTLLFLNNDITVTRPDWLHKLLAWTHLPNVGPVGARLYYSNGKLQHAGVATGLGGLAGHFEQNQIGDFSGYLDRLRAPHEVSSVTGACMAIEKKKFDLVGGFDEENLPVDLNDIDLCLRLAERGIGSLIIPDSVLVHLESATRGHPIAPNAKYKKERDYFAKRWVEAIRHDPYFHPALSLFSTSAKLA